MNPENHYLPTRNQLPTPVKLGAIVAILWATGLVILFCRSV